MDLTNPYVILIEPGNPLHDWIKKLVALLAGWKTRFLIDNIIADETIDKQTQPLLELTISGKHKGHSPWLLMQFLSVIHMNIRRQVKMLYVWYPKN